MALVTSEPMNGSIISSANSLYFSLKAFIGLLEGLGENSLHLIQARLLLTIFEIGHGIYPAAYISSAATVHAAAALGISEVKDGHPKRFGGPQSAEEAWSTWRGVIIANRYATLESEQAPNVAPRHMHLVSDKTVTEGLRSISLDPFTRLAHASQLLDESITHLHATGKNSLEGGAEGVQIGIHITSFLATFQNNEKIIHPLSDPALAICRRQVSNGPTGNLNES
ncbi:hypothetical protein N7470_003910 [Penicillium chermesinum]|nr:hypothetical protein N7470_003910 [Penicillium chermesinum]